tara:strand:+ start:361 stop:501 length:141 start_codon:yes stop_codon:yes gene_type:complete
MFFGNVLELWDIEKILIALAIWALLFLFIQSINLVLMINKQKIFDA